jgi:hypothetical protein
MSSYKEKHKRYYEAHKGTILEKERENKRWLTYYENNKDEVKARNLAKYHWRRTHITGEAQDIQRLMSFGVALQVDEQ